MPLLEEIARVGSFPPHKDTVRRYNPGKEFSPKPHHAGTLVSDFQPPALWKKKKSFCCLHQVYGYFAVVAQAKKLTRTYFSSYLGLSVIKNGDSLRPGLIIKTHMWRYKSEGIIWKFTIMRCTSGLTSVRTGRQLWSQVSNGSSENHKNKEWSSFYHIQFHIEFIL